MGFFRILVWGDFLFFGLFFAIIADVRCFDATFHVSILWQFLVNSFSFWWSPWCTFASSLFLRSCSILEKYSKLVVSLSVILPIGSFVADLWRLFISDILWINFPFSTLVSWSKTLFLEKPRANGNHVVFQLTNVYWSLKSITKVWNYWLSPYSFEIAK